MDKMRKEIEWIEREGPNFGPEGRRRNFNFNDENLIPIRHLLVS